MYRSIAILGLALLALDASARAQGDWAPLLDADSFSSWTVEGASKAHFELRDGVVTGQPLGHNPRNSFLCSPRRYGDFELRFSFRIQPISLNSGVQFRSRVREDGIVAGPQFEMEVEGEEEVGFVRRVLLPIASRIAGQAWSPLYWSAAGVYGEALETGWIFPGLAGGDPEAFQEQGRRLTRPGDWNEARLEAIGSHVRTWLAGELRADFSHESIVETGLICLQVHGGRYEDPSAYRIEWKDLTLRER